MPTHAPDSITAPDQRNLFRDLSRLFEDYCGDDPTQYPKREEEFVVIVDMISSSVRANNEIQCASTNNKLAANVRMW